MINYYFDNTNELRPFTHKLEANDDTLPPDNALRIAPEFKDGYCPCMQNGAWVLVEDHREKTVYNIDTKESSVIDYLGKIKNGFTLLEPFEFCKWNGKKWVLDENKQHQYYVAVATAQKKQLLSEASSQIDYLQDAIDTEIATDEEKALYSSWKKYRALLNRIDVDTAPAITWPEKP